MEDKLLPIILLGYALGARRSRRIDR
jgi:hypothetical protein